MTAEYPRGDEPLIPMPALSLPALRQAVATVAPSRLPEFFQEIQDAFTQAGDEASRRDRAHPARPVNAGLPDRRPRRTRCHHPGELDQLTQAAAEAPSSRH
jgi:hypothetical protein